MTLLELALLVFLLLCWNYEWLKIHELPQEIGGVLPLFVPWGGALGGLTICLVGLAAHWPKWQRRAEGERWNAWYLIRFPLGAIMGSVGALMIVLLLGSIGTTDTGDIDLSARGTAILTLIAFVLGYRQATFSELISRVLDVILGPGETAPSTEFSISTDKVTFTANAGESKEESLSIRNDGTRFLRLPRSIFSLSGDSPAVFEISEYPGNVPTKSSRTLKIKYSPRAAGTHSSTLTIAADGATDSVVLEGTAE